MHNFNDLYETVKDVVSSITVATIYLSEQKPEEKCMNVEDKLGMLSEVLSKQNNLSDFIDEEDLATFACDLSSLTENQEKGVLEKPEKDITNLKRLRKKKEFTEKDEILAR